MQGMGAVHLAMPHLGGDTLLMVNVLPWHGQTLEARAYRCRWPRMDLQVMRIKMDVTSLAAPVVQLAERLTHDLALNGPHCFVFNTDAQHLHTTLPAQPHFVRLVTLIPRACQGFWERGRAIEHATVLLRRAQGLGEGHVARKHVSL
jgi:hypothetical protein